VAAKAVDLVEDLLGAQTIRWPSRARGERRLVLAVLESAVHELRPGESSGIRQRARAWLHGASVERGGFTFARACEVLDLEPAWALRRLTRRLPRCRTARGASAGGACATSTRAAGAGAASR